MAQANGVHMVPERYRKTRFTASCWFYLSQNPRLTFGEYQRAAKDRVCRESVFDDVKKSMEMDRMFNSPDAVRIPEPSEAPPRSHPPQPPPPPNPAMKEALTAGLAASGRQSAKGPITIERRAAAETWIREHLDEGFAQFKGQNSEPELDKAWFDKIRKKCLEPAPPTPEPSMPTATKKKNKTGDAQRMREYFQKISREKLEAMSGKEYSVASGHRPKSPSVFYNEKRKFLEGGKMKAGKRVVQRTAPAMATGNLFQTIAELPVDEFKCAAAELRVIALAIVKAIHPLGEEAKIMILSEPRVMEIRIPYR